MRDGDGFLRLLVRPRHFLVVSVLFRAMRIPVGKETMYHSTKSYRWRVPLHSIHKRECLQYSGHQGNFSMCLVISNFVYTIFHILMLKEQFLGVPNAGLTASLAVLLLILKKPGERRESRESTCKQPLRTRDEKRH